jgi:hypothetical protein
MHQGRYNDGRNHSVTPWCIQDFIFHYTCSLKKKKKLASLQLSIDEGVMNSLRPLILITPAYSYYARLFLLCPVLFPGCYGHVYVFRILGVIMQLY